MADSNGKLGIEPLWGAGVERTPWTVPKCFGSSRAIGGVGMGIFKSEASSTGKYFLVSPYTWVWPLYSAVFSQCQTCAHHLRAVWLEWTVDGHQWREVIRKLHLTNVSHVFRMVEKSLQVRKHLTTWFFLFKWTSSKITVMILKEINQVNYASIRQESNALLRLGDIFQF